MSQQVNVYRELAFHPGAIITGAPYPFGLQGRDAKTYYVNNITGSSTADGLSWNSAFAQPSTAITAVEAHRQLQGTDTNDYIRDTIIIQGTGTRYTQISSLPSYCDVIGLGAYPLGNGAGIVCIGAASGADGFAGSTRGSNWHNIQFNAGGSYWAATLTIAYRSMFEDCAFGGAADNAAMTGALNIISGSGLVLRRCHTIAHAAFPVTGFAFATAAGNFNECLVEDCRINASTTGLTNVGYLNNGTTIRNNIVWGGTTGISDTSTQTADAALAFYYNNFASGATTGMTVTQSPERRCMNNYSVGNATSAIYYALGA